MEIKLIHNWTGRNGVRHYRPDTVYDGDLLRTCGCPRYPNSNEMDNVIQMVSKSGLILCIEEPEWA